MIDTPGAPRPARRKYRFGVGLFIAIILLAAGALFFHSKDWHPSDAAYPLQGIDVSNHQGTIDWIMLPGQGVDFAYIKATEGGDFVDKSFARNWEGAGNVGIKRGAYHFFTLCRPGSEQADNFIATVPADPDALPPVVDLEYMGNCAQRPKITDLRAELQAYLDKVEAHFGKPTVLYLTEEFDVAYKVSTTFDRPLWLRSLVFEPDFGARPWTIWQASNFRLLEGIEGRVDWNAMRGLED